MSLPLYQKEFPKYTLHRALDITILLLLLSLCVYRLHFLYDHGLLIPWFLAFLCESWFTFTWCIVVSNKWNHLIYITHPQNLHQRFPDLPPLDMFVTTADPLLEPPIILINTVLSLLAVDYPSNKLGCYVSDDGCSPITYYSLLQASKFAQIWVPFCKKYQVQVRAPFRYFLVEPAAFSNRIAEFHFEWMNMKEEYEKLSKKIQGAVKSTYPLDLSGDDLLVFCGVERGNHPTIVKVIWENKELDEDGVPHLVYISREKRPNHSHHYKAGAMNVLTRVSGLMTNAPFMLNVDCDMFVNNPEVARQAMCMLLGTNKEKDSAFVQFPQLFYDAPKDDPYGNQFAVLFKYTVSGMAGIQGTFYMGTGCFHRRKVIYGLQLDTTAGKIFYDNGLVRECGNSKEFIDSVHFVLRGDSDNETKFLKNLNSDNLTAASQVASCTYENGTGWGNKFGWMYGSATEDVLTGLTIHSKGYTTSYLTPDPPAFLGCAPSGGPAAMTQQKRWATGLLEILVGRKSPVFTFFTTKLRFRQCLAYLWVFCWSLSSVPEICYAILPAYCILTDSHFLPKLKEPVVCVPVAIFVLYNVYTLMEYLKTGLTVQAWWNNQKMARITTISAYLFGGLAILPKLMGLSETVFEITKKDDQSDDDGDGSGTTTTGFTFDESPIFVPVTALVLVHMIAMVVNLFGLQSEHGVGNSLEVWSSVWVVGCFWSFLKGMFRKGKYGIPTSTILMSTALALLFVSFCWTTTA